MARRPRSLLPSFGIYHVTARGVDRCEIYRDSDDLEFFLALLRNVRAREQYGIHAFCLMPNHYHAIIESTIEGLSTGIHRLNGIYAQRFNERHDRVGHLFQSRFHAQVIRDDQHLANACEYVWNNPVRAGLCTEAHEWDWSGRLPGARLRSRVHG